MSIASVGTGFFTSQKIVQDQESARQEQVRSERQERDEIALTEKTPEDDLPGKRPGEAKSHPIHGVAADLERVSLAFNKRLQFVVDYRSKEIIVKVIDRETDKVIKILPPEELQRLHNKLKETIGFLFDERV